jgi:dTMP kinase
MGRKGQLFITVEGCDGCGKGTLVPVLKTYLESIGQSVILTREPGASLGGQQIRDMLFTDDPGPGAARMVTGQADCLLLYDHLGVSLGIVAPYLEKGFSVISDRYADSQFAYSAAKPHSKHVNEAYFKHYGPVPDVTFLLIGDVSVFSARAKGRDLKPDALEPGKQQRKIWAQVEQQQKIQDQYLVNLSNQPRTIILNIDGLDAAQVAQLAIQELEIKLTKIVPPVQATMFETVQ